MTVNAKSGSGTNDIRFHDYPTVDDGNDSFPEGDYQVTGSVADNNTRMILSHRISGAPLLQRLIDQGKAAYACAIAAPRSGYREVQQSSDAHQILSWDPLNFGEPPYFTPMVVCTVQESCKLGSEDGVHPAWDGLRVTFPKGARLAQGPVLRLMPPNLHSLIKKIILDESIIGQFHVEADGEGVFGFIVKCQRNLFYLLKHPGENADKRKDIMTHVVSSCFRILKEEYKNDDEHEGGWRSYKPLVELSDQLNSAGYCDWSDSSFRPEVAATLLHGHGIPPAVRNDD